ncbi:hypothetical protein BDV41DRAFT_378324 [Aspergillus transmontanensis]|uniref:Uncharacterized protein n=1 Tax=Aspergillus transmontanensis TaxID=1034304 RepID=A0A5N6WCG0_9EURO|nr:hypothetical protein BDV41DRAFT_378324 [Aspergillus transmontanensis]
MRVIDPQSAVLTNIEVLAYLTANPPRRPPNPPPNLRHWVPSPDLRDHNTVVKEVHTLLKSNFTGTHTISCLQKNHETILHTQHQSTNPKSPRKRERHIYIYILGERRKANKVYQPDPQLCLPPFTPPLQIPKIHPSKPRTTPTTSPIAIPNRYPSPPTHPIQRTDTHGHRASRPDYPITALRVNEGRGIDDC